ARVVFGWMTQPAPRITAFDAQAELLGALGVPGSDLPVECYDNGIAHVYVALPSREAVAAVRPDLARLAAVSAGGTNVFAGEGEHWKTRMFAPGSGVAEDAATGSAAGPLALHLVRHGRVSLRAQMQSAERGEAHQMAQGAELARPAVLYARLNGSLDEPRVEVGGSAVTVARGEFRLSRG